VPRDPRQKSFEFSPALTSAAHSTIDPPATAQHEEPCLLTVANNDFYHGLRQIVSDKQKFERSDDSPYQIARLETSQTRGSVQLKPDLAAEQPLIPAEEGDIAQRLWERVKRLSDLEADVLDILTSTWLKQAKTIDDRASLNVDDMLGSRGIKPKQSGQKRRGGYSAEQRLTHLRAASEYLTSGSVSPRPWFTKEKEKIKYTLAPE